MIEAKLRQLTETLNEARNTEGSWYGPSWKRAYSLIGEIDYLVSQRDVDNYDRRRDQLIFEASARQIEKEMEQGL